jgi:iron complex outermembrane receptor protein
MRVVVSRVAIVVSLGLVASAAGAQQDTVRADSGRRLDRMTITATRPPLTTAVGGVGVLVVAPDSLRLTASPVLSDVLREIPFVLVRQNSRGENEISIRGSDSRHQVVLYDGIPLTLGWDSRTDASLIPMGGARSIAVARGLSTLLQGPNVIAGAVAVDLNRGDTDNTVETSAELRTGIDQVGASAVFGSVVKPWYSSGGKFTLRAGGGYSSRDGFPLSNKVSDQYANGDERTNSDYEEIQAYLGLRYTTDAGQWLAASASGYTAERGVPPELHLAEPRLWRYPDTRRVIGVFSGGLGRKRTPFGSGDVEFVVAVNDGSLQIDNYTSATYSQVDATEFGDEQTVTMRVEADHSVGRGEWRNAFTMATVNYREQFNSDPASKYRQRLSSLATELDYPLWGLWRANVGGALESADTPLAGGRVTQPGLDAGAFRVGMSTVLSNGVRLHAAANRRSRFPALRELYSGALTRFEPNPDLKPERFSGMEAGATMFASNLQVQGVFFNNTLSDAILRITLPDGKFQRINRDRLRSTGIELLGNWSGERVTLGGDLMVQHVRVSDPSATGTARRPENVPEIAAGANIDVRFGESLATIAVDFKGAQYCLHPDLGTNVKLRGRTTADAGLAREFTVRQTGLFSRLRAALSVDNAFDQAIYDQCGLPEPGRTVRLGMTLR